MIKISTIASFLLVLVHFTSLGQQFHKTLPKGISNQSHLERTKNSNARQMSVADFGTSPDWSSISQIAENKSSKFIINALEVDSVGNTFLYGFYEGENELKGESFSGKGLFIIKLDINGDLIWMNRIENGSIGNLALGNLFDINSSAEKLVISAAYTGAVTIGDETFTSEVEASLIATYNVDGTLNWVTDIGSVDKVNSVTFDSENNVICSGTFENELTLGTNNLQSANGTRDVFILKLDSDGDVLWAVQSGGDDVEYLGLTSLSESGDIYLTGEFISRDISFGDQSSLTLTEEDGDLVVAKISTEGELQWMKVYGGSEELNARFYVWPTAIEISNSGDLYITGWHGNGNIFGDTTLSVYHGKFYSKFVSKFDADGDIQWIRSIQEHTFGYLYNDIATDEEGSIYVPGDFKDTISFNNEIEIINKSNDVFYAKYTTAGELEWVKTITGAGTGYAYPTGLAVTAPNNLIVTGFFYANQTDEYSVTIGDVTFTTTEESSYLATLCAESTYEVTTESSSFKAPEAVKYQWYYNDEMLEGSVDQILNPILPGEYFVVLTTQNGCEYASEPVEYTVLSNEPLSSELLVYPNPTKDILSLQLADFENTEVKISIIDINGKSVYQSQVENSGKLFIDVACINKGMYLVKVESAHKSLTTRFIKE